MQFPPGLHVRILSEQIEITRYLKENRFPSPSSNIGTLSCVNVRDLLICFSSSTRASLETLYDEYLSNELRRACPHLGDSAERRESTLNPGGFNHHCLVGSLISMAPAAQSLANWAVDTMRATLAGVAAARGVPVRLEGTPRRPSGVRHVSSGFQAKWSPFR